MSFLALMTVSNAQELKTLYKENDIVLGRILRERDLIGISLRDTLNTDTLSPYTKNGLGVLPLDANSAYKPSTIQIFGITYYIIEGDLLLSEREYFQYALEHVLGEEDGPADHAKLIGEIVDGRYLRWPPGHVLRYAVIRASFSSDERYRLVAENMAKAAKAWEDVCGVRFEHVQALDATPLMAPTDELSFVVMEYDVHGSFIARSFFPNSPVSRRQVLIDPSYYTTRFDAVGVLRHELGHVLGWRHEHISPAAPSACRGEVIGNPKPLGPYDPKSVMHYFCGGMGTISLNITETDKTGAQLVSGPPLPRL